MQVFSQCSVQIVGFYDLLQWAGGLFSGWCNQIGAIRPRYKHTEVNVVGLYQVGLWTKQLWHVTPSFNSKIGKTFCDQLTKTRTWWSLCPHFSRHRILWSYPSSDLPTEPWASRCRKCAQHTWLAWSNSLYSDILKRKVTSLNQCFHQEFLKHKLNTIALFQSKIYWYKIWYKFTTDLVI